MKKKFLVAIDDDENNLELLEAFLEGTDYHIRTFSEGKKFLKYLEISSPDVILVDLVMPEISGLDILRKVRDIYPRTPVIIVSGQNIAENEQAALLSNYFLIKPVTQLKLLETLRECSPVSPEVG